MPDKAWKRNGRIVFISGTFDDLECYRKKVAKAIEYAQQYPLEPHYTGGPHGDVRDAIRRQIRKDSDSYIGVFGTRYGKPIPDDDNGYSYSHFEYLLAMEKWGEFVPPPVFIYLPDETKGPRFYKAVKRRCDLVLEKEYGEDREKIARDEEKQAEFLEQIKKTSMDTVCANRMINFVKSESDLEQRVLANLFLFKEELFESSSHVDEPDFAISPRPAGPDSPDLPESPATEQLAQAESVYCAFDKNAKTAIIPGLCILVHGRKKQGQTELANLLLSKNHWGAEEPQFRVFDRAVQTNTSAIWETLWNAVGMAPIGSSWSDTDDLARSLVDSKRPSVVLLLKMQNVEGHLKGFVDNVWAPLYDSLERVLSSGSSAAHRRIIHIILTYEGPPIGPDAKDYCNMDPLANIVDYRKIIPLVEL